MMILPPSDLSARLAIASNDLNTWLRLAGKRIRTLVRAGFGPGGVRPGGVGPGPGGVGPGPGEVGPGPSSGAVIGTAVGTIRKPESKSTSSSLMDRPAATFDRLTCYFPSGPSTGAPVV